MKSVESPCGFEITGKEKRGWNLNSSGVDDLRQVSFRLFLPSNRDTKSHRVVRSTTSTPSPLYLHLQVKVSLRT